MTVSGRLLEGAAGGRAQLQVWPSVEGPLFFAELERGDAGDVATAVLAGLPSTSAVFVTDLALRDALLARDARQVRHVHAMVHDLDDVPDVAARPGVVLRELRPGDAAALAASYLAAYGPGHPDARADDPDLARTELEHLTADPDNPVIPHATRVAELAGRPVGVSVVLRSEHVREASGPWIMNVFRAPVPGAQGVGALMIAAGIAALRADGEQRLGLAVTDANHRARRQYERLGFRYDLEGFVVVTPGSDADGPRDDESRGP